MSNSNLNHDQLLLRLINNDLGEEELHQLRTDEEFLKYKTILDEAGSWTLPELDIEASYDRLKRKRTPTRVLSWYQTNMFKVAAAVVILLVSAVVFLFTSGSTVEFETAMAETEKVSLPDNSTVVLGASSKLTYDEDKWKTLRELNLNGTAYFDVADGKPFKVNFALGTAEVLGTAFEIKSFNNYASVMCYDGKVVVRSDNKSVTIVKGQGLKIDSDQEIATFEFPDQAWSESVVRFQEAPLSVVFGSLSSQFGIEINPDKVDLTRKFSGSYTTRDIDTALKMICEPMDINYEINKNSVNLR